MKKLLIPIILTAIFIAFVGVLTQTLDGELTLLTPILNPSATPQVSESEFTNIKIGNVTVRARKADTNPERQKGLSGTKELGEKDGVLFIFDRLDTMPKFWMKDMLISIDIIWINDGKIVEIHKNVPPPAPGTPDNELKIYGTDKEIDYVLEVNAGFSDRNKIKVGDRVDLYLSTS